MTTPETLSTTTPADDAVHGPANNSAATPRRGLPRMPVAGGLISSLGWLGNTATSARGAIIGPIVLLVGAMDDSGRFFDRLLSASMFMRLFGPLLIGACLVLAGNRLSGRTLRRSVIEALAALVAPPVLACIAVVVVLRLAR